MSIGDLHLGDPHVDMDAFNTVIQWVLAKPNRYAIINGDIGNHALPGSPSDSAAETVNTNEQIKRAKELLAPLFAANRILAWNDGNHEYRVYKASDGLNMGEIICDKFGKVDLYAGDGAFLKLSLGKQTGKDGNGKHVVYGVYVTHGNGGGKRPGSKANNVEDLQRIVVADLYVINHVHMPMAFSKQIFIPDYTNGMVKPMEQKFVCSGSFLAWGGYGERKGYSPSALGCPVMRLEGRRKKVNVGV